MYSHKRYPPSPLILELHKGGIDILDKVMFLYALPQRNVCVHTSPDNGIWLFPKPQNTVIKGRSLFDTPIWQVLLSQHNLHQRTQYVHPLKPNCS